MKSKMPAEAGLGRAPSGVEFAFRLASPQHLLVGKRPEYHWTVRGREETPVTVCVAAMYDSMGIIGASDRMLTAGDVQFEPQQSKIRAITTSIVVMIAGHSPMQEEILQGVYVDARKKIDSEPAKWLNVGDVAEFYRTNCNAARNKRAENSI